MADKKKESNDISDVFDDKELQGIIKGFGDFKKYEDEKKLPEIKSNLYKTWEDSYQNNLKDKLAKKFKDEGGLKKKLDQKDEGVLKEVAHDFFIDYLKNATKHSSSEEEEGRLKELQNQLKQLKAEGKDAYQHSSNLYHTTLGVKQQDKTHMDNVIQKAMDENMTGAEFLNLLQEEVKGKHVGSHQQRIYSTEFTKRVGHHEDIKYRAAINKMMKEYKASVDNHGTFKEVGPGESYALYKGFKHGEPVDFKGMGVKYTPAKPPQDDKK